MAAASLARAPSLYLIVCNEGNATEPGVQRVRLSASMVETILTGMVSCDLVRCTAWGTIIVGEEAGPTINPVTPGGWLLEIINPLQTTNVQLNLVTGALSGADAGNVATRAAPGRLAWEGIALYQNGVISPLVAGKVYWLRLGKRNGNTDYGQGSTTGLGTWVEVANANNANLRTAAASLKLTGYYRPEREYSS